MQNAYRLVWKKKDEITQSDKDAVHFLAMSFYPEGRTAYEKNYWYSSVEPDALLILYDENTMISYCKYVVNNIKVGGQAKTLAGFSLLTHADYQGKGIAGAMVDELQRSMLDRGTDILYATTIFPQVEYILEKRGFVKLTNKVSFIHTVIGKKVVETETVLIFAHDAQIIEAIQNEQEFFIGQGPM